MSSFERYYQDLLEWEGVQSIPLIAAWNEIDVQSIGNDFSNAILASNIYNLAVPVRGGSTNQSIGNQIEEFLVSSITRHLERFEIRSCSGHGYPDRELREKATRRRFPLEFKATSRWNPSDTNRCVLTSSSTKLRENFAAPINHLLVTVCYDASAALHRIFRVRLDFIQPGTEVNVRLEASVNHKILNLGAHPKRVIEGSSSVVADSSRSNLGLL